MKQQSSPKLYQIYFSLRLNDNLFYWLTRLLYESYDKLKQKTVSINYA